MNACPYKGNAGNSCAFEEVLDSASACDAALTANCVSGINNLANQLATDSDLGNTILNKIANYPAGCYAIKKTNSLRYYYYKSSEITTGISPRQGDKAICLNPNVKKNKKMKEKLIA